MPTGTSALLFAISLAAAAAVPGPSMAALMARAIEGGIWTSIPFCVGLIVGDLMWFSLSLAGAGVLTEEHTILWNCLRYAGAAYLVFIASRIWAGHAKEAALLAPRRGIFLTSIDGLVTAACNPKTMLFYLALLPAIFGHSIKSGVAIAIAGVTIVVVLAFVMGAYLTAAMLMRGRFRDPRSVAWANRLCGTLIAMIAVITILERSP